MSEHIQKSDHAARQSRRGGKRLAAGQAERERKCPPKPPEVQPEPVSAPTAVKPLIPEWAPEAAAGCAVLAGHGGGDQPCGDRLPGAGGKGQEYPPPLAASGTGEKGKAVPGV